MSKIQFFCGVIEKKMSTDALQHVLNNSVLVMGYTVNFIVTLFFGSKMEGGLYRDCTYKVFCFVTMVFEIIKVFKYMSALN